MPKRPVTEEIDFPDFPLPLSHSQAVDRPFGMLHPWLSGISDDNINAISGALAGVTAGVAVCPLDVAKTRLQAQGGFQAMMASNGMAKVLLGKYSGIVGTLSTIYKEESVRGLYRGLVPIVIGYIPTWTIYFMIYEKSKRHFLHDDSNSSSLSRAGVHIGSAITAGACSTLVTNPIWVVKTRLMTQSFESSAWRYKGTFDAIRTMYRTEGWKVFYQGLGPSLLGLTHVAVQFPLYELFKSVLTGQESKVLKDATDTPLILIASTLSKIIASTITYPHEVIRTRNQIQTQHPDCKYLKYKGIVTTFTTIFREEGWRPFYAGLGINMFRAVPSSAVTLMTFELVRGYLMKERSLT